jgi:hypothetical protein
MLLVTAILEILENCCIFIPNNSWILWFQHELDLFHDEIEFSAKSCSKNLQSYELGMQHLSRNWNT